MDVLDELPAETRTYLVTTLKASLGINRHAAEKILRASEPFWNTIEQAGPLVDSWGGGEFSVLFPKMMAVLKE